MIPDIKPSVYTSLVRVILLTFCCSLSVNDCMMCCNISWLCSVFELLSDCVVRTLTSASALQTLTCICFFFLLCCVRLHHRLQNYSNNNFARLEFLRTLQIICLNNSFFVTVCCLKYSFILKRYFSCKVLLFHCCIL